MDKFEKKLKKAKSSSSKVGRFLLIIAIVCLLIGICTGSTDKESWATFDGISSGEYYKTKIYYLVGPFAEYTENGEVTEKLYSAYTTDNLYIVVKTGKTTELPIWGEDVTEENIEEVEPVTAYEYGTELSTDLASYLVEFWNEVYEQEIFTTSNYIQHFENCYLNTKDQAEGTSVACYIFALTFGLMVLMVLLSDRKNNKKATDTLKKLEEEGILEIVKNEYSKETVQEYPKINLDLTESYIISYTPELVIVPFTELINAYHSNMIDGIYQPCRYITLETIKNEKYYVAPKQLNKKEPQFEEALEKIKSKVKQGGN